MLRISIALLACIMCLQLFGQTYTMSNATINTCSGTFYDSGGSGGNYMDNQNLTMTFCSSTPGANILIYLVYPSNIVQVFNRWGNKIYESNDGTYNQNPWDGRYNGEVLPVGSY